MGASMCVCVSPPPPPPPPPAPQQKKPPTPTHPLTHIPYEHFRDHVDSPLETLVKTPALALVISEVGLSLGPPSGEQNVHCLDAK